MSRNIKHIPLIIGGSYNLSIYDRDIERTAKETFKLYRTVNNYGCRYIYNCRIRLRNKVNDMHNYRPISYCTGKQVVSLVYNMMNTFKRRVAYDE